MDYWLIFFVFTGGLLDVASAQIRQYYFLNIPVEWTTAQTICRTNSTDLATIENTADVSAVLSTTTYAGKAWIGLYDDLLNSWRWSLNDSSFYGERETEFRNWQSGQPNNLNGQQYCVELVGGSHNGTWGDIECTATRHFVCYNGTVNGNVSYVKINNYLTWTEAQRYCREHHVDLASIRNQTENDIITNLTGSDFVWIGLHREKVWSDGSTSLFRHWATGQPNSGQERCVTTAFSDSGRWSDDNCTNSFPFICYLTISFRLTGQNETSISLQWNKVNNYVNFILQFNGTETNFTAPAGDGPINHTVSSLTAGTRYTFTVFSVFENVRSSGVSITAVTVPANTVNLISTGQDETSIRLQWNKVNNNVSFILQFNGTETNITSPAGDGPINHTVSSLTAGTRYTFTVFSVFENVRSSGVSITAVTAPPNTNNFRTIGHNKTSITLQWNKVNNNVSFILQFNGTEINISAPVGDGPITYTVSSLTAGTTYTFTLFSVFENIRSSGVNVTAVTDPHYVVALDIKLKSSVQLSESEMHQALEEFLRQNGLPPQVLSVKVQSAEP